MTRLAFILSLCAIATFALLQGKAMYLPGDTTMLLHTTAHMLFEGGVYQRWLTVNSPMIYWIYSLPVLAITELHFGRVTALYSFTLAICVLSLFYTDRILRAGTLPAPERRVWITGSAIALLVAPWGLYVTGDREHFLYILALPWMLQMLLRMKPRPFSIVVAVLGLCIKPYDLLFLPALILFGGPEDWSLRRRLFSASSFIAAAMLVVYVCIILVLYPGYPHLMIPIAFKAYGTIAFPLSVRLRDASLFLLVSYPLLSARIQHAGRRNAFLAFCVAAALVYVCNAGWIYTVYLFAMPLLLAGSALLCPAHGAADEQPLKGFQPGVP